MAENTQSKDNSSTDKLTDAASAAELGMNLPQTPGTDDSQTFFQELDRQVSGDGIVTESPTPSETMATQTTSQQENPSADDNQKVEQLEKRYSDSSREGKRLNTRLKEIEPYMPILDAMKEDPNLITHVRNYFEGGGSAPTNMREEMGIDDDFVMDVDDALSNPASDSGKLFNATVDGVVQKRMQEFSRAQQEQSAKLAEESNFKSKMKLEDGEFDEMMQFANNHKLSLDDIYYLKNRENHADNVARSTRKDMLNQMKGVRERPTSVSNVGSAPAPEKSPDDQVFDSLLGTESGIERLM
jgi:hypothetical protein